MTEAYTQFDFDLQRDLDDCKVDRSRIPCKVGCAHCCEQAIFISLPEAHALVMTHRDVVRDVRDELERQEILCKKAGLTKEVLDIFDHSTGPVRQVYNDHWWNLRQPCAFLDRETKTCRVYSHRPLACRSHLVVDTDPAQCELRPLPGETAIVQGFNPPRAYDRVLRGIYEVQEELYGRPVIGTLQKMVLYAFEGRGR
jgi:Fe-S-cluster containining protein